MNMFSILTCILATCAMVAVNAESPENAPLLSPSSPFPAASSADCSTLMMDMMPCLNFLEADSDLTMPDASCCSGFKQVLNADPGCICVALAKSASFGITVNMTQAAALPSDCGVSAPPLINCNINPPSPVNPPTSAPAVNEAPVGAPDAESRGSTINLTASFSMLLVTAAFASFSIIEASFKPQRRRKNTKIEEISTAKAALTTALSSMGKTTSRGDAANRAECKFEKKLEFYAKVRQTVASLATQKAIAKKKKVRSRQKKLKAYDLSTFSEFLPELKASQLLPKPAEFKLKSKTRQRLVLKEGNQFRAVINHPAFQSDPLGAIHQHLQSTQPTVDEKPKRRENKNGNRKGKKKSKASAGLQLMEI
ncbi:hypothetical protein K7X08_002233 [Anisodus acutangulus]|uniref:Bifunctional inhibitor/plant lipid transfer protein/seed storage helical domain-containing protein n=1 Tax=Anisodus acutangulus TaxID=402998 RepID=A0A9Q1R640_9SOLA|nr:hypothetical protein K7X08_002233 [Anisodus acutangulus]